MGDSSDRGVSVGVTSLAVIFTVIVLTVFAVLAYSTASSDAGLARKYADSVQAWWEADCEAEGIKAALRRTWDETGDTAAVAEAARAMGGEAEETAEGLTVSYTCPVDASRSLSVRLEIGKDFTVAAWQTVPAEENWQPDSELELLQ